MAGRQRRRAERTGGVEQIAEFDLLIATDAGDGGRALCVGFGEIDDNGFAEPRLVIQHIMGDAQPAGDIAGVGDVGTGATASGFAAHRAIIIKSQRDAHHVIAAIGQDGGRRRGIDAARHGHDNARALRQVAHVEILVDTGRAHLGSISSACCGWWRAA